MIEGISHISHPLFAGRRCYEIEQKIEKDFDVKIYMHAPTVKVFEEDVNVDRHYDRIYVTGAEIDVQKAVSALRNRVHFLTRSSHFI
jgi:hypothetical protein